MSEKRKALQLCAIGLTARYFLRPLIERLEAEGYEMHLACSADRHARHLKQEGLRVHEIEISRSLLSISHVRSFWQIVQLLRREQFDVVHVHTPIASVLGRVAARICKVPFIVYTAHGFYFHEGMKRWMRRLIIWIERWLGSWATDLLLTVSREDRETAIRERIMPSDSVAWIGNGVRSDRFAPSASCDRAEWGLNAADLVVGYVGRFVREKGLVELLDAVAELRRTRKEVKLLLVGGEAVGDRGGAVGSKLKAWLRARGLVDATVITGFQEDVAPYYGMMDIFVLPSYREGFPMTILEAMASGLPVVASEIRGCREEVIHGKTGILVPPGSRDALADAIERLLSSPPMRASMGALGRAVVREQFEEAEIVERQVRLLAKHHVGSCKRD